MAIEGFIGVPGAGKTLAQTRWAYKRRKSYHQILTNYGLNRARFDGTEIVHFTDATELLERLESFLNDRDGKRRLVLMDEVHLIFDARMWSKVPPEFLRILAQPRKAGLDMLYTAQHESQVEKRLRVVTNYLWLCKSYLREFNMCRATPLWFTAKCWESFEFRKPHARQYGSMLYRCSKSTGDLYDTFEVLDRMNIDQAGTQGLVAASAAP